MGINSGKNPYILWCMYKVTYAHNMLYKIIVVYINVVYASKHGSVGILDTIIVVYINVVYASKHGSVGILDTTA